MCYPNRMKRIFLFAIITALIAALSGCAPVQRTADPHVNMSVLMGDTVPCVNCEEDVEPIDGHCPICGALLEE